MASDDDSAEGHDPPHTIQARPGQHPDDFAPNHATIHAPRESLGQISIQPPSLPGPRYELQDEIARGGMGRVVNANDTRLGRIVALKEALALDADSLRRFDRETQITARLEHPSIVPVHDAGKLADGTPFYVMRKIGGRPLEKLVASAGTLNERLALIPHIVAAAHAVAHAHDRGIIHRDIKPSNILCGELGETIVIDWGLAKVKGEPDEETGTSNWVIEDDDQLKTRAGIVFGTPGFMAPEQLRGNTVNERTDVYALGATLYHLLSRKPPHHAKTADEMMRAAVRAKPVPLDQLVDGVPPELITIVDKALSMDARTRYQHARELSDDLQRFLTGQLVASHHYTPRAKLARFIRKNRVPVFAVTAAAIALIVIGTVAVVRVINERDRADDERDIAQEQRTRAEKETRVAQDRLDKLTLQQARSKAVTNPTEAIAMMKSLARKPEQWRDVRSIAAAARANGVAWSLPAPKRAESVEMSRDGKRVLVAGADGSVQIYDLVARSSRVLVKAGAMSHARFADNETKVVTWAGTAMAVLDARTGAVIGAIKPPTKVVDLEIVGVTAYWTDEGKKVWQLDLAGSTPVELPVDEAVESLAPSPDGRWVALVAANHLLLHDRTQPTEPPRQIMFGKVQDLDWSDDGAHLALLVELGAPTERVAADASIATGGQIVHRVYVGTRTHIAWSRERMFTIGAQGVGVVSRNETTTRKQINGAAIGLRETLDGVVVAASTGGLAILTDDGDHVVPTPDGQLEVVEASTRAPYVVGFLANRMLVWNLAEMLPRRLADRDATREAFTGNDRVLVAYPDAPAEWMDLATGKSRSLPILPAALLSIDGSLDGTAACVVDASHHARLITETGTDELGAVDMCAFARAGVVLGSTTGSIQLVDPVTKLRTPLLTRTTRLVQLAVSRGAGKGWIAGAFLDASLWRVDLESGQQATTPVGRVPTMIAIRTDGAMVFPQGPRLMMWATTNELRTIAELGKPIDGVGLAGDDRAIVFTEGGLGYAVELSTKEVSKPFDLGVMQATQSPGTGLLVYPNRGAIEVFDPVVNYRWTLASSPGVTYTVPQISNDGHRVIARRNVTDREKRDVEKRQQNALLAWQLVIPATPEDTARWLDQLTNAIVDDTGASLTWR